MDKNRGSQGILRSPSSPPSSPPLPSISLEGKAKVDKLLDQVNSIPLTNEVITSKAKEPYVSWCLETCTSSEILKYAVERLHHYWLNHRTAVAKSAVFLCANWFFEVGGMKMRQELLLCLQKDFENRLTFQAQSPHKFLNSVAFLVEMFTKIRIENEPMKFLTTPVFQSLEDLLTGDDSEIELFTHLVVGIGSTMQDACDSKDQSLVTCAPLQNLFCKVRSTLMSRNLSSQSRLWLLFVMDISSSGDFYLPSSSLQTFYQDKENLGSAVNCLIKSLEGAIPRPDITVSAPHIEETVSVPEANQMEAKESVIMEQMSEIKISPKSSVSEGPRRELKISPQAPVTDRPGREFKISPKSPVSDGPTREFNIAPKSPISDGAGRNGFSKRIPPQYEITDKREGFRSALNTERSKGNKGKSYWLHDDRFEDDTPMKERNAGSFTKPRASEGNWRRPTTPKDDEERKPNNDESWRPSSRGNGGRDIVKTYSAKQPSDFLKSEECWD